MGDSRKSGDVNSMYSVKVDNLSDKVRTEDLRDAFSRWMDSVLSRSGIVAKHRDGMFVTDWWNGVLLCMICRLGEIGDVYVPINPRTGMNKGFGFVRVTLAWIH